MSPNPLWPEPEWLAALPEEERAAARLGWLLDICAMYATREGSMSALSIKCNMSPSTVGKARHIGVVSPRLCIAIENAVGRHVMPREVLCPEIFAVER